MKRINKQPGLRRQMQRHIKNGVQQKREYDGDTSQLISSGSTLLDLAISGGRVRGGGIPGSILVEIFGASGSGKTVLLCEIAGAIQRKGGEVMFHDPEARLNKQFATIFDLNTDYIKYDTPNTVTEVFEGVRNWKPVSKQINGAFTDSLAALSTDLEMDKKEGDKMGMRRAKEFSEELRKTCRILKQNNYLMVCSNQIRENTDMIGYKYKSPGGQAIGFYSSLRLRAIKTDKIKKVKSTKGKDVERIIGVTTEFEVFKSSVWKPYRTAPVTILFDYGIDDIRGNLQFIKDYTSNDIYTVLGKSLDKSLDKSIRIVEHEELESKLKFEVIELWNEVEKKFDSNRKRKIR